MLYWQWTAVLTSRCFYSCVLKSKEYVDTPPCAAHPGDANPRFFLPRYHTGLFCVTPPQVTTGHQITATPQGVTYKGRGGGRLKRLKIVNTGVFVLSPTVCR